MQSERSFHDSKLRLARLLNGCTKAELADRLNVSRQFVHSLEISEKLPNGDMIAALALALKVLPSFFLSPLHGEVREEECHFRSRRSMSDKLADQIVAYGTMLELLVKYLDVQLTLPKVDFLQLDAETSDDIEQAAEKCRHQWKLGSGPISNMCRVLENAGAIVTFFDSQRHEVDALSIAQARPIVVRNTIKESPGRLRFDLAHECAHLVIHQGIKTGDKGTESQANRFASAFLMPRDSFGKEFPSMSNRLDWHAIYSLKVRWRVSAKAIIYRAHDLGLINEIQYTTGNRYLHSSGQARNERYDERIPFEEPELVRVAVRTYIESFNVTPAELAARIDVTPAMLNQIVG